MIKEATEKIQRGINLTKDQMRCVMEEIMQGKTQTQEIVDFLIALNKKGETPDEVEAAVVVMRSHATSIKTKGKVVLDTCGTGGDRLGTFNISTCVAFVASACGITVAKHGNRSVSSACGSADILEALGININLSVERIERCLEEVGIAFLFAPNLHPAMKYAMPARKKIQTKTIFNILGPLTNPADATHQLIGVYDDRLRKIVADVLKNLGTQHALVVHADDGLDEITLTTSTKITEVNKDKIMDYEIIPEDFGFKRVTLEELKGGSVSDNVKILQEVLSGKKGPKRDIVVLNAAAAIYAADKVASIKEGIALASQAIDKGLALKKLTLLKEYSL
ncbi:MAG: anthranilate phosphoribosyltransferase [Candidatus Omnitrophica bacterium]|nr:anthranilate phosphoribosyltransferase [Candidatus Omnitrophota bacterium]